MEPWDRVVGSRTVPDTRMVIWRKAGALASSRRRVMFRRKGTSWESELGEIQRVGDEVVRAKVKRA